jgi:hypothetical protein
MWSGPSAFAIDALLKEFSVSSKDNLQNSEVEIKKVQVRIESLQDKFADNLIEVCDYNSTRKRHDEQLRSLKEKKQGLNF